MIARLLREPLVHFMAAGGVLFAAFALMGEQQAQPPDDRRIVVDRESILTFMQYRANAFEPEAFAAVLDAMSEEELQALTDAYVEEETLYREAKALGLDESDYIIRQRMIQKMSFLLGDVAVAGESVEEAALAAYFEANREAYSVAPSVTFTHVFFDAGRRGEEGAREDARAALDALAAAGAGFNDAPGQGDRFPFLRNYVERTFEHVASHFGAAFAEELARLPEDETPQWRGPLRSAYGWHAVLVTARTPRRLPALADVREDVEADYRRDRAEAAVESATVALRARYEVEVEELRREPAP